MAFKKLIEPLKNTLEHLQFETPLGFQKVGLPKIKSGVNVFGIGPEGSGKTTTLILSVVQKLKGKAFEDAPRAIIVVKDKQEALALRDKFNIYTNQTDLRVYCAYEEHNIDTQREEIYDGIDVLIATPKRLNKLFLLNSINLSQLKMFIIEDAEFSTISNFFQDINRISESINKCQYVVFAKTFDAKIRRFQETFMYNSQKVEIN
ncbi:DEAD/DEAH box helicase [Pontimicrobium aquaticum]|uniref:DEAD/DEAH box helicase n=1 Tax=Pontimicrobium aquaticum TaxID=2565367 RepID=A0A4U0EQU2_9FLAO|nr:DEAD/DEAH box helicase [Pontimicrobium aquaticum]TJY34095.1 DEAD/DEAH box helicase [Pontimicrobium aquaticum]